MDAAFILLYIIVNLVMLVVFYKRELGVFQPPFLVACISLTIMVPQLTTIYFHPYYDNDLLYKLCYVMITCNIAFAVGFDRGKKTKMPTTIRTLDLGKMQYLTLAFSLIGFSTIFIYGGNLEGAVDGVIAANLKIFAIIGMSLSFITLLQGYRNVVVYACLMFSIIPMVNYAFFIKGSRTDSLILFLNIFLYLSLAIPKKRKLFKVVVLSLLLLGSFLSASISGIRRIIRGDEDNQANITELSYWDTFKNSFTDSYTEVGMDLGNAALGIEYCYQNNSYDYGMQIWNGFVYNYVPKRLVGDNVKEGLYYETGYQKILPQLTNKVTTMTGYFYAFSAFSFFGFIFFLAIGYLFGVIWQRSGYSDFYKFLFFFMVTMVPAMITHGLQLFFSNLEFSIIFMYPIILFFLKKMRLRRQLKAV